MPDKPRMTVQELTDAIHQGLDVSDDDLAVLFDEAPVTAGQPSPGTQGQTAPAAPTPQAPTVPVAPPAPAPTTGQPNELMNILPEKFRGESDPNKAVSKLAQSYGEVESELSRNRQELSQLKDYVQKMLNQGQPAHQPTQPVAQPQGGLPELPELPKQDGEEDDISFLEKPRAESRKEALRILMSEGPKIMAHMLTRYDTIKTRQVLVDEFKKTHQDFDLYREELMQVFRENPWLDQDISQLPRAYDMAKDKFAAKQRGSSPTSTTTAQPQTQVVDVAALKAEIKAELLEGIRKRRAAGGVTGGSAPVTPQSRTDANPRQQPQTEEDKIWDDMMNSGPANMKL